jgi:ATP-dependent helicase/nuclease subunit A
MKIRIITASAGSGKTTRLSQVLDEAVGGGRVRPDGIVAATFTRQAAAELIERARSRLLASGRGREAHQLLAARIGTVNSVCGTLVADYAFELGLSPRLRVLDEGAAEIEQKHALAAVVPPDLAGELYRFTWIFDQALDWHFEVRKLIEGARANGLGVAELRASADRSVETMSACLGPAAADGDAIDRALLAAIDTALASIDTAHDETKGTATYVDCLRKARRDLERGRLRWGDWAKLTGAEPTKKSRAHALPVARAAARHIEHPRLRAEMERFTRLVFQVAADGLAAYQAHKRERGVIDFIDQETLALRLLRRPEVRADLAGQLDLVLIDEFQDTSPLQLAIFLELAALATESVWVGDPKQAIYGFRGTDPALMDAAIESLTSPSSDPELVREAVSALERAGTIETLAVSYRSRPELVHLTSDIFARAFAAQGMPEERTRLTPVDSDEPTDLGPVVEHWPLCPERANKETLAAAAASGVRTLLRSEPRVRDRTTGAARTASARDLAVLCRTNEQCQKIADALAALGIPAVVPRMRLLDTAEGQTVMAGLRLWIDPRDPLAAAILARLTTHATDLDGLLARALAAPGRAFDAEPIALAIAAARRDLDPVDALAAVIDAADLRGLCAAWGQSAQRLANLDALRAHAITYAAEASAGREAATLPGLVAYLEELTEEQGWNAARSDRQALLGGEDAVTVSTWHRAKGLEWPITVLYGLESLREPLAHGVHVMSDRKGFDVADPLAGRWVRFWPNPYTTANQGGPVKDAFERSDAFATLVDRAGREALRVLYVGWTRARDRLVLAAHDGKLTRGLLGTLDGLLHDPGIDSAADLEVTWAGRRVALRIRPAEPATPAPLATTPGEVTLGRPVLVHPPARILPSAAPPLPCALGATAALGPRMTVRGNPDMHHIGYAVHAFLATDRGDLAEADRVALAAALLRRFRVDTHLDPAEVAACGTRLRAWLDAELGATRIDREWPVGEQLPAGTVVAGTADLVARGPGGLVLVDHKTFPGSLEAALARVPQYSGQLAAYARALAAAGALPVASTWIHLPVLGAAVELRVQDLPATPVETKLEA